MSKIIVEGGKALKGEMSVEGAKNAVLPILAATILNNGINIIRNCPRLKDVETMLQILNKIGCKTSIENDTIIVDSSTIKITDIPEDLAVEMRSSIILLGPMLSRFKKVTISYPGVCDSILAQQTIDKGAISLIY